MKLLDLLNEIVSSTISPEKIEEYKERLTSKLQNLDFTKVELKRENGRIFVTNFSCRTHDWTKTSFTEYNNVLNGQSGCPICVAEKKRIPDENLINTLMSKLPNLDFTYANIIRKEQNGQSVPFVTNFSCKKHSEWTKTDFTRYNSVLKGKSGCPICRAEKKMISDKDLIEKLKNNPDLKNLDFTKAKIIRKEQYGKSFPFVTNFSCRTHDWTKTGFTQYNNVLNGQSGCPICVAEKKRIPDENLINTLKDNPDLKNLDFTYANIIRKEKYGKSKPFVTNFSCKIHTGWTKTGFTQYNSVLKGESGCPICRRRSDEDLIKKLKDNPDLKNLDFTNVELKRENGRIFVTNFSCKTHTGWTKTGFARYDGVLRGKSGCGVCANNSKGEETLNEYLKQKKIEFERGVSKIGCFSIGEKTKRCFDLPFDFHLIGKNILIEVDGAGHFEQIYNESDFERQIANDKLKNKFVKNNNYKLIRLYYDGRNFKYLISEFERLFALKTSDKILLSKDYPKEGWNKPKEGWNKKK